jgi:hypothetical protein
VSLAGAALLVGAALALVAKRADALDFGAGVGSGSRFGRKPSTATAAIAATKSRPTVTLVVRCMVSGPPLAWKPAYQGANKPRGAKKPPGTARGACPSHRCSWRFRFARRCC